MKKYSHAAVEAARAGVTAAQCGLLSCPACGMLSAAPKAELGVGQTACCPRCDATLYARKDPVAAKQLLLQLVARAKSSEASSSPDPFVLLDAAYLTEAYKQWPGEKGENPANGLDGLPWIKRSMQLRPDDPQMAFAAALITLHGPESEHRGYTQIATAGANNDQLLKRNLATHFLGAQSPTMAEMILKDDSAKSETKVARL